MKKLYYIDVPVVEVLRHAYIAETEEDAKAKAVIDFCKKCKVPVDFKPKVISEHELSKDWQ